MAIPQHVTYGVGGTITIDVPTMPTNAQVRILQSDGTEQLASAAATLSTINTTINAAYVRGDMAINVASNVGMSVGKKAWITDDPEEILIRKISGGTISLRRPLVYDHVSGSSVKGTRLTYAVNAATANALWWDGRAEWNIDGRVSDYTVVECTKYPLRRLATATDIADIEPKFYYLVDSEQDIERLLDLGFEEVWKRLSEISPDLRVRVYTGSAEFIHATALAALMYHYLAQRGEEAGAMADRYATHLKAEVTRICQVVPRDTDQDGEVEEDERVTSKTRRISRA